MKLASIDVSDHAHGRAWQKAFAKGLECHGWTVGHGFYLSDLAVFWGTRRKQQIQHQLNHGGEVCILECGYIGNRLTWSSVSFGGGLNGCGVFRGPFEDGTRWQTHFSGLMKPLRGLTGTRPALIMGQVPGDMSVEGVNLDAFYDFARRAYAKQGIETRFRPHPLVKETRPLEDDFDDAEFVITWNSNSAVDAVFAGLPVVAMDEGSMAWPVASHSLTVPVAGHRTDWAHAVAWKQWRLAEMESGFCWDHVRGDL